MRHTSLVLVGITLALVGRVSATVPLSRSSEGHDTVPATVQGRGPYPFILDSGADGTAIYPWLVKALGLAPVPGAGESMVGATGTAQVPIYALKDIVVDGHRLAAASAYGLPARHDGGHPAGALGNDFMDGQMVVFDYPCRRLELYPKPIDPGRVIGDRGAPIALSPIPGNTLLTLPVTINGVAGIGVLDTGMRVSKVNRSFAAAAKIDVTGPSFNNAAPIWGSNSRSVTPRGGRIGTISFGGISIRNATAQVMDLASLSEDFGNRPAIQLGADLLAPYRMIYDHQGRALWLRHSACSR